MRWTRTLVPTLRDDPQEAEIPSHRLMLRAGLIRKLSGGLYTFMPLGLRALRKVERIVREEMDRAGAIEIQMPALQPREIWEQSGRYDVMGPVMFRLRDRQERQMVLGPTHEEVVTSLVAAEVRSYRQLPITLYQIQTKFRDEIRPRFGLMRAKEFIMKDAYSFDIGWDEADVSYKAMYDAYVRIFQRCGLRTKVVEADTGAMGGKWSHEFMVLAEAGEDGIVECNACDYAANLEKAEQAISTPQPFDDAQQTPAEISTPGCRTIDEVAGFLRCEPSRLIKTLIYVSDGKPFAVLVPGDRDVNECKLARVMEGKDVALAANDVIESATGAPVGFAGPVGLRIPILADLSLRGIAGAITGGNKLDTHLLHVDLRRDAQVKEYHDLVFAKPGDRCPRCTGTLKEQRGIEVGHVFKLGTKYSDAFDSGYLDADGARKRTVMGCYGIGVTRTLQAIIEQSHDAKGIIWPSGVAPYSVAILALAPENKTVMDAADALAAELEKNGIDTVVDDRPERPGVKFNDADLIGFPVRVVVSERSLAKSSVEIKTRTAEKPDLVPLSEAVSRIGALCRPPEGQ